MACFDLVYSKLPCPCQNSGRHIPQGVQCLLRQLCERSGWEDHHRTDFTQATMAEAELTYLGRDCIADCVGIDFWTDPLVHFRQQGGIWGYRIIIIGADKMRRSLCAYRVDTWRPHCFASGTQHPDRLWTTQENILEHLKLLTTASQMKRSFNS